MKMAASRDHARCEVELSQSEEGIFDIDLLVDRLLHSSNPTIAETRRDLGSFLGSRRKADPIGHCLSAASQELHR
jgi:hypothetical protein